MENNNQRENKIKKVDEKKEEKNPNINNNIFKYIYFIVTYDKSKQLKIYLSPEYKGSDTLEKVNDKPYLVENQLLTSDVYRFKIIENGFVKQKEYQIPVKVESGNEKYQHVIKLKDLKKDFYEYNFVIENLDILLLDYQKQFEIYVDILRNKFLKEKNTPENEDLILSTQNLFVGKDKKCKFLFYVSILLECYNTKYFNRHLLFFKPEKIAELGEVDDIKLENIKNELNKLAKEPENIHIENERDKQKTIKSFYSVILYFNLHFQKEKVKELFKNEKISELLYEKIIKLGNFFKGLILPKENVKKLIQKANDYNQVLNFLPYLGKDVIQFLETIDEEREKIRELYEKEKIKIEKENKQNKDKKNKKSITIINIEKYTQPKKEHDFIELNPIMNDLIIYQQENGLFFTKFSNSFFEKYIELNKVLGMII